MSESAKGISRASFRRSSKNISVSWRAARYRASRWIGARSSCLQRFVPMGIRYSVIRLPFWVFSPLPGHGVWQRPRLAQPQRLSRGQPVPLVDSHLLRRAPAHPVGVRTLSTSCGADLRPGRPHSLARHPSVSTTRSDHRVGRGLAACSSGPLPRIGPSCKDPSR